MMEILFNCSVPSVHSSLVSGCSKTFRSGGLRNRSAVKQFLEAAAYSCLCWTCPVKGSSNKDKAFAVFTHGEVPRHSQLPSLCAASSPFLSEFCDRLCIHRPQREAPQGWKIFLPFFCRLHLLLLEKPILTGHRRGTSTGTHGISERWIGRWGLSNTVLSQYGRGSVEMVAVMAAAVWWLLLLLLLLLLLATSFPQKTPQAREVVTFSWPILIRKGFRKEGMLQSLGSQTEKTVHS